MLTRLLRSPLLLFVLLAFGAWHLQTLMSAVPGQAGYDYRFGTPRLFEGVLSFKAQGLVPPFYSSFICGGFPLFADPESLFYSLPQLLSFVIDPWSAAQLSAALLLILGGLGTYLLCRRTVRFQPEVALLASMLFATNGFFRGRMLIGHLHFHQVMFIPWVVLALLDPKISRHAAVLSLALLGAAFVYGGGHYISIFLPAIVLVAALTIYLLQPTDTALTLREVAIRILSGGTLSALLCCSKIVASWTLMHNYVRRGHFDFVSSGADALQLLWSMLFAPGEFMPFNWGLWEYDASFSATVALPFIGGILLAIYLVGKRSVRGDEIPVPQIVAAAALILTFWLSAEIASGGGRWIGELRALPIINQLRVNMRFIIVLVLPISLIAAWAVGRITHTRIREVAIAGLVLATFLHVESSRQAVRAFMSFPVAPVYEAAAAIGSGEPFQVRAVDIRSDDDMRAMANHRANPGCYVSMFGRRPTKQLTQLTSVDTIKEGKYNLLNPACIWFPKENGCKAGERIDATDTQNFELFRRHINPNWKRSPVQHVADFVSLSALALIAAWLLRMWRSKFNRYPTTKNDDALTAK